MKKRKIAISFFFMIYTFAASFSWCQDNDIKIEGIIIHVPYLDGDRDYVQRYNPYKILITSGGEKIGTYFAHQGMHDIKKVREKMHKDQESRYGLKLDELIYGELDIIYLAGKDNLSNFINKKVSVVGRYEASVVEGTGFREFYASKISLLEANNR